MAVVDGGLTCRIRLIEESVQALRLGGSARLAAKPIRWDVMAFCADGLTDTDVSEIAGSGRSAAYGQAIHNAVTQ